MIPLCSYFKYLFFHSFGLSPFILTHMCLSGFLYYLSFKKVQKAYAFEIQDVPVMSEYLEVRYSVSHKHFNID